MLAWKFKLTSRGDKPLFSLSVIMSPHQVYGGKNVFNRPHRSNTSLEFISRFVRNNIRSSECDSVVQEREITQPRGEPLTYESTESRNIETKARDVAQFERVRYVIDDGFTVRAVPEENISCE